MTVRKKHLNLVSDLSILEVSLHQTIIDVYVCGSFWKKCFQQNVSGYQELLLLIYELKRAVAITKVMQSDCLSEHIISYTTHLDSIWREEFAAINKAISFEGHWIVSFIGYEHTDDALVSVDDEVATEFIHILLLVDQLGLSEAAQIAIL